MSLEHDLPLLIRSHIPSVWALELLLLLRRGQARPWDEKSISDELRATVPLVAASLKHFEHVGLVARDADGGFQYRPASSPLAAFCDALAVEYRERPVAVINLIAAPEDRIQQLADAFRFKRDGAK
jgi:hypothetical protein